MSSHGSSSNLPRGSACVVCRSKKSKCDGNRPKCNQCIRSGKEAECEYGDRPAPNATRVLEGQIAYIENRIRELERNRSHAAHPQSLHPTEPPPEVAQYLINHFIPHTRQVGCFMDLQRAFSNAPDMHALNALRAVVYLWGAKFSRDMNHTRREPTYLANTLQWLRHALASAQQQRCITLHLLQTEILVAMYMFSNNRLLEGQSHYAAAVSLALACGLHKLFSSGGAAPTAWLSASITPAEDVEKINAWWTVFTMEKSWAAFLDVPTMLTERVDTGTIVETPWPRSSHTLGVSPGHTVKRFMNDVRSDPTSSPLALQAKAAILLNLSGEVASYQVDPQQLNTTVMALDQAIEIFKTLLPSIAPSAQGPSLHAAHELLVAHSFVHAATIRLFKNTNSPNKDAKCFSAAFAIIRLINDANVQRMTYLHPALAMVWGIACDILVPALVFWRTNPHAGMTPGLPRASDLQSALTHLRHATAHCAANVALFGSPLEKLNQIL